MQGAALVNINNHNKGLFKVLSQIIGHMLCADINLGSRSELNLQ